MVTENISTSLCSSSRSFRLIKLPANVRLYRWLIRNKFVALIRRLYDLLCLCALRIKADGTFELGDNKRRVRFDGRNGQFHSIYDDCYKAGYEPETTELLKLICKGNGTFVDVGANWGYFSLFAAILPEFNGKCVAFEPNPDVFADLQRTVAQAFLGDKISARNLGLGKESGLLVLENADEFRTGLVRLLPTGSGRRVPVKRLDDCQIDNPLLIKIDAEGMESEILEGARGVIESTKPFIIVENFLNFSDPEKTLSSISVLEASGYLIYNPCLKFEVNEQCLISSYGDPISDLLLQKRPYCINLIPVTKVNRYIMRQQLNLFACHKDRLNEVTSDYLCVESL